MFWSFPVKWWVWNLIKIDIWIYSKYLFFLKGERSFLLHIVAIRQLWKIFWCLPCRNEFIRTFCSRPFVSDKIIMMNLVCGSSLWEEGYRYDEMDCGYKTVYSRTKMRCYVYILWPVENDECKILVFLTIKNLIRMVHYNFLDFVCALIHWSAYLCKREK
jgi:hypothetical protein